MSNHWGSHMLNEALEVLERRAIFARIGPEETQQVVADFLAISDGNDGNRYEVLDELGKRLRICYECAKYSDQLEYGLCPDCSTW